MEQTTTIFAIRCAQQQAQLLSDMLSGVLELLEAQPEKSEPCQHPQKSRQDLSTFSRMKWMCRECGFSVDEERPVEADVPPKPAAPPLITFKEGEIPERHPMTGSFS